MTGIVRATTNLSRPETLLLNMEGILYAYKETMDVIHKAEPTHFQERHNISRDEFALRLQEKINNLQSDIAELRGYINTNKERSLS